MTRDEIRRVLAAAVQVDVDVLIGERDAVWVSDDAVAVLDRIGASVGWDRGWGMDPSDRPQHRRRMIRPLREVLNDVVRVGRQRG
ncbi:MAG TPA: hypothetical protein VMW94_09685 [Actinomycetes bacterium]|nr:hypothetical protein [Actinomycetes bacterium]